MKLERRRSKKKRNDKGRIYKVQKKRCDYENKKEEGSYAQDIEQEEKESSRTGERWCTPQKER